MGVLTEAEGLRQACATRKLGVYINTASADRILFG
jgi:hypothetical protein